MQGNNQFDPRNQQPDDGFSDFFDESSEEVQDQGQEEVVPEEYGWGSSEAQYGETQYGEEAQSGWGEPEAPVEPEPVLDKKAAKAKAKQDKLAKKNKAKQPKQAQQVELAEEPEAKQDMILYIVIDKAIPGLVNYFRECGVKVSNIFNDIVDAKNTVLMQSEPIRIVVVDTGLGKFTTTSMRAELIDMLGIADENSKTTVFYTDSALKVDTIRTLGKSSKKIDWIQYKSTSIVAGSILNYNENYVYDMEDDLDEIEKDREALNFKGLTSGEIQTTPRHNIQGLSGPAIMRNMIEDQGESLPSFEIKL